MANFHQFYPHKFNNKTNGVIHRRWLANCNPDLAALITDTIGSSWMVHPEDLANLVSHANDKPFQEKN